MWLIISITLCFAGIAYRMLCSPLKYTAIVSGSALLVFLGITLHQGLNPWPGLFFSVILFIAGVVGLLVATLFAYLLGDTRKNPPLISRSFMYGLIDEVLPLRIRSLKTITESVVCERCNLRYPREQGECTCYQQMDDRRLRVRKALSVHHSEQIGQTMLRSAIVIVAIIVLMMMLNVFVF